MNSDHKILIGAGALFLAMTGGVFAASTFYGATAGSGLNFAAVSDAGGHLGVQVVNCDAAAMASCQNVVAGSASVSVTNTPAVTISGTPNVAVTSGTVNAKLQDGAGNAITSSTRGAQQPLSVQVLDSSGNQITAFGGSTSGFPGTQSTGTPIAVTTSGVTGTLPSGTTVVATNTGTTNAAYCKLGAAATTSDQYIAPNGGWFAFAVGGSTQMTCITSTSTTTVNLVGGSGLPTGTGGGGGGVAGSNGAVGTPPTIPSQATRLGVDVSGSFTGVTGTGTSMNVNITNLNSNGQKTMALSAPVVIASDQSTVPVNCLTGCSGGGGASSTFGATFPTTGSGTPIGVISNTGSLMTWLKADASQNLNVNVAAGSGLNVDGQTNMANSAPVVIANDQTPVQVRRSSEYPQNAIPVTSSTTGSTGSITATLAGTTSKTTFICGYSVRANASAVNTNTIVVSGTISGSLNFLQWTAAAGSGLGVSEQIFTPCIPASAQNTSIVVTTGAPGAGGAISVAAWGYQIVGNGY